MTLVAGATIGPYRIIEQVGRGGMATVYKAYQAALARNVAIKVLPAFFAEDPGFRERFQQEAIAVAKLRHPNILAVFDYGEENGVTYIVSEFVDGGTLAEQLGTPLPADYAVRILGPIASALDYAHARGVLHRDVKPSNVLLARDGTPILSDFGLAKMIGSMPRLTQSGTTVGTPEYMAPEQALGAEVGPGADLYALAVVAYEMLTGRVPFTAETPLAVLLAHVHKPLPLPRTVNPSLSAGVEAVLLKGLAKTPPERYPTATELVHALGDAARGGAPAVAAAAPLVATPIPAPTATAAVAAATAPAPAPAPARTAVTISVPALPRVAYIGAAALFLLIGGMAFALSRPSEKPADAVPAAPTLPAGAVPAATPTAAAGVPKGDLLYEAKLDAAGSAVARTDVAPDPSAAEVRLRDGAMELAILKPNGTVGLQLRRNLPTSEHFSELEFNMRPGAPAGLQWWLVFSASGNVEALVVPHQQRVRVSYLGTGASVVLKEFDLPEVDTAKKVTLGVAVQRGKLRFFADGKEVGQVSDDRIKLAEPGRPISFSACCAPSEAGVTITGVRLYALAGAATAPAAPAATPVTTLGKGQLLWQAKLEPGSRDIASTNVFPDPSAGTVRITQGAVELAILRPQASVAVSFSQFPPTSFFVEYDLQMSGQDLDLTIQVRSARAGSYHVKIRAAREDLVVEKLECSGQYCDTRLVSSNVALTGLRNGRQFTLGLAVQPNTLTLFVDGKRAEEVKIDPVGEPVLAADAFAQGQGVARIVGVRLFQLAGGS